MTRRKTLRIPDDGPCAGHPCDGCDRCLVGDCCGGDVGEAGLPLEGSWPHQHFGVVGVLVELEGLLTCSCCGERYEDLARHLRAHNLSAHAYRAMWGLNTTTALVSSRLRCLRSDNGHVHGHRLNDEECRRPTSEQRSRWSRDREARAETRLRRGTQPRDAHGVWVAPTEGTVIARLAPKPR